MINEAFKNYEEGILKNIGMYYSGLSWCELGNQSYSGRPAKDMYIKKGVGHTSIDINGLSGSLKLDLDNPIPHTLENKFDVITNYGTTEHVNNQYSVFKNIHMMCRSGGIMIHGVPLVGNWLKHCRYHYSKQFFSEIGYICKYSVIDFKIFSKGPYCFPNNLIACVFRKENNFSFPELKCFLSITGLEDSGDLLYTGDYVNK